MSDEQESTKKRGKQPPPVGGINRQDFSRLGRRSDASAAEGSEVQNVRPPEVQTSKHLDVQTSGSLDTEQSRGSKVRKSKHPEWRQKTVYLPPDVEQWLNVQAAVERREISEIVADALKMYRMTH